MAYIQVPVDGSFIQLRAGGVLYDYHSGGSRDPFLCEQTNTEIVVTSQSPFNIKQTPTISIPPPRD